MPPIELGAPGAVGPVSAGAARKTGAQTSVAAGGTAGQQAKAPAPAAPKVETSAAMAAGEAPVDTDRVSVIRKAVESGTYPVIPTRIADAMIAAGVMLRSGKP